jgi:very-short-patch-repair endonuclease
MYGPSFPKIRMVMKEGVQYFESRTNQNLFLGDGDFDADGTFTMARFLQTLPPCRDCGSNTDVKRCCPLVVKEVTWDGDVPRAWKLHDVPDLRSCPGVDLLLGYCDTDSQKRFLNAYLLALYPRGFDFAFSLADGPQIIERSDDFRRLELLHKTERLALDDQLSFPALIPEAWLNAIGAERTVEDEEHLDENPQRVDFVLFLERRRCVIEVDGPSHYATFDEASRTYEVSEERYTRNLRIERSLRRQGWEIYRFSNYEVRNAKMDDFKKLLSAIPGLKQGSLSYKRFAEGLKEFDTSDPDYIPF